MTECSNPCDSPCVRNCVLDQATGYCLGCGRTLSEISYWTRYTAEERRRILDVLPARRAAAAPAA